MSRCAALDNAAEQIDFGCADKSCDKGAARTAVKLFRRADLLNNAFVHHHNAVAHGHGFGLIMGNIDGCHSKALLQPYVEAGREVICFSISGSMSTSGNVMRLAAEELDAAAQVTIIDSENLSTGIGLLVVEAAIMAEQGHSAAEITAAVRELIPKVRASFVVDTLVYLWRGGRCNAVAALAGSALRLHPKIVVENGAMHATKKYRGKIDNAIMSYVKDMEADLKAARPDRVFITHSGCSREVVEEVRSYLKGLTVFCEILETRAGGVISSHCGPGTLGVLFIAK